MKKIKIRQTPFHPLLFPSPLSLFFYFSLIPVAMICMMHQATTAGTPFIIQFTLIIHFSMLFLVVLLPFSSFSFPLIVSPSPPAAHIKICLGSLHSPHTFHSESCVSLFPFLFSSFICFIQLHVLFSSFHPSLYPSTVIILILYFFYLQHLYRSFCLLFFYLSPSVSFAIPHSCLHFYLPLSGSFLLLEELQVFFILILSLHLFPFFLRSSPLFSPTIIQT